MLPLFDYWGWALRPYLIYNNGVTRLRAFIPAAISGFFSPVITDSYLTTGAKGGGVTINKGVWVDMETYEDRSLKITTLLNGAKIENSIAEFVARKILGEKNIDNYNIIIKFNTEVPISSGYGTSAASAYATAFALNHMFNLKLNRNYLLFIAHMADIIFKTGLGSVCGYVSPGFVIIKKAGAPHIADIINLEYSNNISVFSAWYSKVDKKAILSNLPKLTYISKFGDETLNRILDKPTIENFFKECWNFSLSCNLSTPWVKAVIDRLYNVRGVLGVTQTQIGEAIFGVVLDKYIGDIERILREIVGNQYIIAKIYDKIPLDRQQILVKTA